MSTLLILEPSLIMKNKKYRLYIDESGTHNYSQSEKVDKRYLSLLGVMVLEEEYINVIQPKIHKLKRMFADDFDELPILHREDIVKKRGCFQKLNYPGFKEQFNSVFLDLIENSNYTICCVVLDKKAHLDRYGNTAYHPYHYCLNILLERYTFLLEENNARGDVVAEARGKIEDRELRGAYRTFYCDGTFFRDKKSIQMRLTSSEIKVKSKPDGFDGLEFADLLVLAAKLDTLYTLGRIQDLTDNFCKQVIDKIQSKYRKDPNGSRVNGYGKKLI